MDMNGVFLAHGNQQDLIWKNYINYKDALGTTVASELIKKAREGGGGGWVTYEWRGSSKNSYVQLVEKEGKEFIIAAGYYPHSKQDTVVNMVKGAIEVVKKDIDDGRPIEQAFSTISYLLGRFVVGDLYLYAMRFSDGMLLAHGAQPNLVGSIALEEQDTHGVFINKEIIKKLKLKKLGDGVWVDYISKRAPKKAYAERLIDTKGTEYFIACGYYPDADRNQTTDLVRKGFQFMEGHGLTQAVNAFSRQRDNEFIYGDLNLFVYDLQGHVISNINEAIKGQNHWDKVDEDGHLYVQDLIKKAEAGGGWLNFKINKQFKSFYVEPVELGINKFVIGSAFYPSSKRAAMTLLAKSAVSFIHSNPLETAFAHFVDPTKGFIRGDLEIYVFDLAGNCYAYGDDVEKIWSTMLTTKDEEGLPFVKMLIEATAAGPATINYQLNKRPVVAHAERIEKDGVVFVVGSNFQT